MFYISVRNKIFENNNGMNKAFKKFLPSSKYYRILLSIILLSIILYNIISYYYQLLLLLPLLLIIIGVINIIFIN